MLEHSSQSHDDFVPVRVNVKSPHRAVFRFRVTIHSPIKPGENKAVVIYSVFAETKEKNLFNLSGFFPDKPQNVFPVNKEIGREILAESPGLLNKPR